MKLRRELGFWDVFCIASGAMISSGLFVLPGLAYSQAGPGMIIAYALAGVMVIPAMLSKAELSTAMPKAGGSYFFIERSLGTWVGTLAGFANWFSVAFKAAFALVGIGVFAKLVWPVESEWVIKLVAIGFCLFFAGMNMLSVKTAGRFQLVIVLFILALLAVFVFFGFRQVELSRYAGIGETGLGQIFATAGLVFISFGGLTKVASVAGEVKNPGRNIPAGMAASVLVVSLLYVAASFVVVGVVPGAELADPETGFVNLTPLSTAAGKFMGPMGMVLLSFAAMLALISTANSGVLSASRVPMAMSHDGLLPTFFQKVSHRFSTPQLSIAITAAFMIFVISSLSIVRLIKIASTMMLILFALVNVAVLVMRGSKLQNYRPIYRAPFFPWIQIAGIIIYVSMIVVMTVNISFVPILFVVVFVLIGTLWFLFYARPHIDRESALVYMVRNVVSKKIYRSRLEEELKHIAFDRDDITHDRFDRLIQNCDILDLDSPVTSEQMLSQAADALADRLGRDPQELVTLFKAREDLSSTVIQPGLAVPHIIVEGQGQFEILLVRCKGGMQFPDQCEPVHTAFILVGSPDERNYHLRALMAIAHIVQEHGFVKRWLDAPNSEHLRDIVLLSDRQRNA